jgi:hypothetical protein
MTHLSAEPARPVAVSPTRSATGLPRARFGNFLERT